MQSKLRMLGTAVLVAATAIVASPSSGVAADPDIVTLSGAGPQGRWFKEAALFGKVLTREMQKDGVQVNGVIGKGVSVGNIKRIAADRIQGGRFYIYDLQNAYANKVQFEDGKDYSDVVVWMKLGTHLFRVVADKDIKKFSELKGKKVAIGVKGSGDDWLGKKILAAYGVNEKNTDFQYLGRTDGQAALANSQIDAIAFSYARNNRGHLGPVFAAREIGKEVDFVEPDADKNEAFLKSDKTFFLDKNGEPVFGRPDLTGIAFYQGMAISKDLSEELVYKMTKALYENWDEVLASAPWWKGPGEANLESAPAITTVPYHPGAIRYYKEKGVWKKHHGS